MTNGLVSVVVPMYNAARFVRETLASVRAQTYPHWELIVVDDGSTDGSFEIAEKFTPDARVRVVSQANAGVATARNRGLALSEGEFVAFLDADDVWLPTNLEAKVEFLREHPECALAQSEVAEVDADLRRTGRVLKGDEGWVLEAQLLWDGDPIPAFCANALLRRKALEEVGAFDPSFSTAADQDLKFRLAARFPIGRVPGVMVCYRVHGANMHTNVAVMERDHLGVYRKAEHLGLFPSRAFRRRCLANAYFILAGSWWHSGHKARASLFVLRSLSCNPRLSRRLAAKGLAFLRAQGPLC